MLSISPSSFDRVFTILLMLFVALQLWGATDYGEDTRLFPFVIGLPVLGLLVFLLLAQNSRTVSDFIGRYSSDLFDHDAAGQDSEDGYSADPEKSLEERRLSLLTISGWLLGLFGSILLVGFVYGTLVFFLAYYWYATDHSVVRTIVYSTLVWGTITFLFSFVLQTRFFEGYLFSL